MVELTWQTATHGPVTFIAATLDNRTDVSGVAGHRVQVEVNATGAVWPPVDGQLPAAEWNDGSIETTVAVGEKIGIGVACEGQLEDPPLRITEVTPASPEDGSLDPIDVLRELGDPTPPEEAIPLPEAVDATPQTEPAADQLPSASSEWVDEIGPRKDSYQRSPAAERTTDRSSRDPMSVDTQQGDRR